MTNVGNCEFCKSLKSLFRIPPHPDPRPRRKERKTRQELLPRAIKDMSALIIAQAAFGGAWLGNRLLPRLTLRLVQLLVACLLLGIALALGGGLI